MEKRNGTVDRRTLFKMMGAVGAATTASACGVLGSASAQEMSGGAFEKEITLATAGPGGNKDWKPGETLKFLPPEEIRTGGKAADQVAALPKPKLLQMYERMLASRRWETAMKEAALGGKDGIGGMHMSVGEEATAMGTMAALNDDDYIASTHRGHAHLAAKGGDLNKMSAEIMFRDGGCNKGYGGTMHITEMDKNIMGMNGIVGASFYLAAGAALRGMVRGTKQVAVAFFSDGSSASPWYFSAARSATNLKIPVIFMCENNFYASGAGPIGLTVPTKYISEYTKGLSIPHHLVDGTDVTAVYSAMHEAVEWARAGNGPSVIEAIVFRWYDHNGFAGVKLGQDGAFGLPYRTDEEVRAWMSRDPIAKYKKWLLAKGLVTDADLQAVDRDVDARVVAAVEYGRNSPHPAPENGLLNTYAGGPAMATQFLNRRGLVSQLT